MPVNYFQSSKNAQTLLFVSVFEYIHCVGFHVEHPHKRHVSPLH